MIVIAIDPMGAPRQVQSDKWRPRPAVVRYRAFRDALKLRIVSLPSSLSLKFVFAMPPSWSEKKRLAMCGTPHKQKPDLDNCVKAVLDALLTDDAHVWNFRAHKVWGTTGLIVLDDLAPPND